MRKKIESAPYLEKDDVTKAVLNTDSNALSAYRRQREVLIRANKTQKEVEELKKDISDIKIMLSTILGSLNTNK